MKKQTLLLFGITAFLFSTVKAQKADTIRAKATYEFIHVKDTLNRDKTTPEEMVLLLGHKTSAYLSMDKINFDIKRKKDIAEQVKNAVPGKMSINITGSAKKLTYEELYYYIPEKKLITKKRLVNNYIIEEALPEINWTISADTSTIAGLKCQKATTHFKGRDYTAWFCPDLPFQNGPWKLNGLPGLIVAAHDAKNDVVFKFLGFENLKHTEKPVVKEETEGGFTAAAGVKVNGLSTTELLESPIFYLPKGAIKTTEKEYQKLAEAMKKDPMGFMASSMPGVIMKNTGNSVNKSVINTDVINNPIEIPEVK